MAVGAGAVRAGRAYVEIFADSSKLASGLKAVGAKMQNLGGSISSVGSGIAGAGAAIAGLGASVLAPMAAATNAFITAGDQLQKMAIRTGVGAEALSELSYAAAQSGTDLKTLETGLARSQRAITEANDGSKSMADTFARLGVNTRELASLAPDQQFQAIATAIAGISDPTERAARAMQIFGRSGTKLLPLMTDDMAKLRKQAQELGITLTQEDADAAAKLGDAFDNVKTTISAAFLQVGAAVAGPLTAAADGITKITSAAAVWVRENRSVVVTIGAIGAGLVVVGGTVAAIGTGVIALGATITALGTVWATAGAAVSLLAAPFAGVTALGVAGFTAVAAIIGTVIYQSGLLTPAIKFLRSAFGALWSITSDTFGGILNALKGGEWGKAAEIGWAGVKLASLKGAQFVLQGIQGLWNNAGTITTKYFGSLLKTLWSTFAAIPKLLWAALKGGASFNQILNDAIGGALTGNMDLASKLQPSIDKAAADLARLNRDVAPAMQGQQQRQQQQMPMMQQQGMPMPNMVPPGVAQQFRGAMPQAMAAAAPAMAMAGGVGGAMVAPQGGGDQSLLGVAMKQLQVLVKIYEEGGM